MVWSFLTFISWAFRFLLNSGKRRRKWGASVFVINLFTIHFSLSRSNKTLTHVCFIAVSRHSCTHTWETARSFMCRIRRQPSGTCSSAQKTSAENMQKNLLIWVFLIRLTQMNAALRRNKGSCSKQFGGKNYSANSSSSLLIWYHICKSFDSCMSAMFAISVASATSATSILLETTEGSATSVASPTSQGFATFATSMVSTAIQHL